MRGLFLAGLLFCACAAPSPGLQCADDAACGDELVCQKPAGAAYGVCSFAFSVEGDRCLSNGDCGAGLFCSNDLSVGTRQFDGTCEPLQEPGAPCSRSANCQPPLVCKGATESELGACG